MEEVGNLNDEEGIEIELRKGREEIMIEEGIGVGKILMKDNGERSEVEKEEKRMKGLIIGEFEVEGKRSELGEKKVDILKEMRKVRMEGDMRIMKGSKIEVDIIKRIGREFIEEDNIVENIEDEMLMREFFKIKNMELEVGEGFLKIEIVINRK